VPFPLRKRKAGGVMIGLDGSGHFRVRDDDAPAVHDFQRVCVSANRHQYTPTGMHLNAEGCYTFHARGFSSVRASLPTKLLWWAKRLAVLQFELGCCSSQASFRKSAHFSRLRDLPLSDFVVWEIPPFA
jgi:hypothetical protein